MIQQKLMIYGVKENLIKKLLINKEQTYMKDERTKKDLKEFPVLEDGRIYIYIMLNNANKIKIGKTTNIQQRYQSLCGSNSQGNNIVKVCVSPSSYLHTIEMMMHNKFSKYRIPNTEWFYDKENTGELTFENVVKVLHTIFSSNEYKICNETRKQFIEKNKKKEKTK